MVSQGQVLGAAVRVVVITPILVGMYLAFTKTKPFAKAVLGGVDPGAVIELLTASPESMAVVPISILVAILGPALPSRTDME